MRRTRWLLLVAIVAILGGVGVSYHLQRSSLLRGAPSRPAQLPLDLTALSEDWEWTKTENGRPLVNIRAKSVQQGRDSGRTDLGGVQLRIFHKDGKSYDLVKSATAWLSQSERRLHSEGDVEITLGVPLEGEPKRTLVAIHSSAVMFDIDTGQASTEAPAQFFFENGTGKAVGASYDPTARELRMASQVELNWKGPNTREPMKLETGELIYREEASLIWLQPWARLTRNQSIINAGPAVVAIKEGEIERVEAQKASGEDRQPGRQVEYAADQLWVHFGPNAQVQRIDGQTNARVVSKSAGAATSMTADRLHLEFAEEAVLRKALGIGGATMASEPRAVSGKPAAATRVLRSETIEMHMRAEGREIEKIETHAPGTLEFRPNRQDDRYRKLTGSRMTMLYGPANHLQSFRSIEVATETHPPAGGPEKDAPVTRTKSQHFAAEFDATTGQMTQMEQREKFQYEAGSRRAKADYAVMDSSAETIVLENGARVWDADGSTSADRIRLNQRSGDVFAEGRVNSSRVPEKASSGDALLSGDQPLQAIARTMTTSNRNRSIRYDGDAILWQGANRLQAQRVEIDRDKRLLTATGGVTTQFREEPKAHVKSSVPVFTIVKAPALVYSEETRLAHYTGGAVLNRPGMNVKSAELRAFLASGDGESKLERALADGAVEIVQTAVDRTRKGTGEHGEYYVSEEKIILRGGNAQLTDSKRGETRGTELTYWANDDRLLVTGAPGKPASSRIRRN
jgi:lipopolysaccharide export system protein LptA